jgi:hypothetical protein
VEEPAATPVARPVPEIVATDVFEELQVTELVMTPVLESEYVPVAVNCCVAAIAIAGFAGVTAIDVSVAAVTVRIVEPVTVPDVARIVDVPVPTPFARPAFEIVATPVVRETHATELVMFCVDLSL